MSVPPADPVGEQWVILESAAPSATAGRQEYRFPPIPSSAYGGAAGLAFVDGFLDAAFTGVGDGPAPIEAAQRVLEILDALYQSAATGCQVDVTIR